MLTCLLFDTITSLVVRRFICVFGAHNRMDTSVLHSLPERHLLFLTIRQTQSLKPSLAQLFWSSQSRCGSLKEQSPYLVGAQTSCKRERCPELAREQASSQSLQDAVSLCIVSCRAQPQRDMSRVPCTACNSLTLTEASPLQSCQVAVCWSTCTGNIRARITSMTSLNLRQCQSRCNICCFILQEVPQDGQGRRT